MSADMESSQEPKSHKKSKQSKRKHDDAMDIDEAPESVQKDTKKKKEKTKSSKDKKRKDRSEEEVDNDADAVPEPTPAASPEKKHKRQKSSDDKKEKKHKKSKKQQTTDDDANHNDESTAHNTSILPSRPSPSASTSQQATTFIPSAKDYPFFTQTFSQRVPVWPAAFDAPLTKISHEYLDPLLNRYSPKLRGVLLAYRNVNLSERPVCAGSGAAAPTDATPVTLASFECYAPPFAWLTAELHLFVPSRGAWMAGEVNLQSEGHIGVVCFGKFNASISRRSLPRGWKWVEREEEEDEFGVLEEEEEEEQEEEGKEEVEGEGEEKTKKKEYKQQLRSNGYWVDEKGDKVGGTVYFRIKNFSSGSTGDYTYLSLQGTMLDDEAEKKAAAEERAEDRARRARGNASGLLYPTMRLPESSMTKLKDISV